PRWMPSVLATVALPSLHTPGSVGLSCLFTQRTVKGLGFPTVSTAPLPLPEKQSQIRLESWRGDREGARVGGDIETRRPSRCAATSTDTAR
ncbi:unnamed protein product, partial [Lota lota]